MRQEARRPDPFEDEDSGDVDELCSECKDELQQATDVADELRRGLNDCQREAEKKQLEYDEQIAELQRQLREALTKTPAGRYDELRKQLAEAKAEAAQHKIAVERLRTEIATLTKELERAKQSQPVEYLTPAMDDGLRRMREAMKLVSDRYPASRSWVQMVEQTYRLLLSGEA